MKTFVLAAVAALSLAPLGAASPAFAHAGVVHNGCDTGQGFAAGDIAVTGAFTRATLPGARTAGGFMTIVNAGPEADRLLGASTKTAKRTEIHEMKMEGDMMKMRALPEGVEIPAGGTVELAPGGFHVMMMGLVQPLVENACVEVILTFEKAGELPVMFNVGAADAKAAPEHAHH